MMNWKILLALTVSYFIYLLIGAAIFMAVEGPNERSVCEEAKVKVANQLEKINSTQNVTLDDVRNLTTTVLQATEHGVSFDSEKFKLTCPSNWDFQGSFFFSGTVVTTIGYGHISPSTGLGQTLCILYAILGIPLFALMFSGLGERFASLILKLESKLKKGNAKRSWVQKTILILIVTSTLIVFGLLIPAVIFTAVEGWEYGQSFYYAFITLTTIGFGDYVVGIQTDIDYIVIYRILVYFWILFGMAFMATIISLTSDFFKKTGQKHWNFKRDNVDQVDGDEETAEHEERQNEENIESMRPDDDYEVITSNTIHVEPSSRKNSEQVEENLEKPNGVVIS